MKLYVDKKRRAKKHNFVVGEQLNYKLFYFTNRSTFSIIHSLTLLTHTHTKKYLETKAFRAQIWNYELLIVF